MSKIKSLILLILLVVCWSIPNNVFAEERKCNFYASQGKSACNSASYNGYKCEWNNNAKGGARCKQSNKLSSEKKETITACNQIKSPETCNSSKIDGHECIWRQNACYDNALIDDGTDENIVANDQEEREEVESTDSDNNKDDNDDINTNTPIDNSYVGENICGEESVKRILVLVGYILVAAKIIVPLLIIGMGTKDVFAGVIGKDQKDLTNGLKSLLLRIALGVFIFFIPSLVEWSFELIEENSGQEADYTCVNCVLNPNDC